MALCYELCSDTEEAERASRSKLQAFEPKAPLCPFAAIHTYTATKRPYLAQGSNAFIPPTCTEVLENETPASLSPSDMYRIS